MQGKAYLIGAGPGDPDLLTLRAAALLRRCDVVLFDGLVNPEILRHAAGAEQICVGKHGQSRIWTQEEVTDELIRQAAAGRVVARLKGGDPAVFARGAEEAEALAAAGIPFEIVPGITAALAAGSYAGIPVTHRPYASAVALVTGHEQPGKPESALDWQALAHFPGTLVIYMGVTTVRTWSAALLSGGKPADTPTAIVRRCSLPDQTVVLCRLDEVAEALTPASKMRPPVIVIVGDVTRLHNTLSWFQHRPLFGRSVLITRPEHQAASLAEPLRELGAQVWQQPAIRIEPPENWADVDEAIRRLSSFDWIVFSSANGVTYFLDRLLATQHDIRALSHCRIAAIGSATDEQLRAYRLCADYVPESFRAEELAQGLVCGSDARRFLLIRASRGREVLAETLRAAGRDVTQTVVYQSCDITEPDPEIQAKLAAGEIDWITVTSSAIARSLVAMFGDDLRRARLVSISPITSGILRDLGYPPAAEAADYTMQGVADALLAAEQPKRS